MPPPAAQSLDAEAVDAAVDAAVAPADRPIVPADAGPDRSPNERLVRAIVSGETPLADAVDRGVGLVSIRYLTLPVRAVAGAPSSDQRHCGAALSRALPAIVRDLADAVRSADAGRPFRCTDEECVIRGAGPLPAWHLRFSSDGFTQRLVLVAQVDGDEVAASRARTFIDRRLTEARRRPCGYACMSTARDVVSRVDCVADALGGLDAAVREYGALQLAASVAGPNGDAFRAMSEYIRRRPNSPLAATWQGYLSGP